MKKDELYHYGILGQKWGIRRYQNEDGTYTEEGLKRKQRYESAWKPGKEGKPSSAEKIARNTSDTVDNLKRLNDSTKDILQRNKKQEEKEKRLNQIRNMSDKELQDTITRYQREKQLNDLMNEREAKWYGKSIVDDILNVAAPAVAIGASAVTIYAQLYKIKNGL